MKHFVISLHTYIPSPSIFIWLLCCFFFAPPKWPIMWSMSYGYYHYCPSPTLHFVPCALFSPCNFFCYSFLFIRLLLWPFNSTPSFYFFLPPLHLKCRTEFSFLTRVRWRQIVNFSLTEQFRFQLLWMIYAINLCVYVLLSLLLYSQFISIQWVHYIVGHTSRFRCVEGDRRKFSHILPLNGMIFKGQLVWWERVIVTHVIIVVVAIDGNSLRLITFVLLFDIILSSFSSQPERKMKLNPVNLPKTTSTHT